MQEPTPEEKEKREFQRDLTATPGTTHYFLVCNQIKLRKPQSSKPIRKPVMNLEPQSPPNSYPFTTFTLYDFKLPNPLLSKPHGPQEKNQNPINVPRTAVPKPCAAKGAEPIG